MKFNDVVSVQGLIHKDGTPRAIGKDWQIGEVFQTTTGETFAKLESAANRQLEIDTVNGFGEIFSKVNVTGRIADIYYKLKSEPKLRQELMEALTTIGNL